MEKTYGSHEPNNKTKKTKNLRCTIYSRLDDLSSLAPTGGVICRIAGKVTACKAGFSLSARSQYWIMLGRLGFSLFQLKLSIIYTDNFCLVSLSYVERDNKKQKQNMFPFDFFVIDHFVANFDQKMLEKRDIKKNIFSMALGRTYA